MKYLRNLVIAIVILVVSFRQFRCQDNTICERLEISFTTYLNMSYTEVKEGGDAVICCNYEFHGFGRPPTPFWRVQSPGDANEKPTFLYNGDFPANIRYNHSSSELIITNISREMNGKLVACCFDIFDEKAVCENKETVIIITDISTYGNNYNTITLGTLKPTEPPISYERTFHDSLTLMFVALACMIIISLIAL